MADNGELINKVQQSIINALNDTGLMIRGDFFVFEGQQIGWLIGNSGQDFWQAFTQSREYLQQQTNPIDSYSERIINALATKVSAELNLTHVSTAFPSAGPPYYPFQRWAVMAEQLKPSPLGILMHPLYGLWHAYRGAILFAVDGEVFRATEEAVNNRSALPHPCDSCVQKPCLTTCPVGAFAETYHVSDCANYVMQKDNDCYNSGCAARLACPYAPQYRYNSQHHCFHLHHFARKRATEKV